MNAEGPNLQRSFWSSTV